MKKRGRKSERYMYNKAAFDEICGDPYAIPEPISGHYAELKSRSSISIMDSIEERSPSPVNQAKPNHVDFFCDVEAAIQDGLETYAREYLFQPNVNDIFNTFLNTYVYEAGKEWCFSQKERADVEQIIGQIFRNRGIFPVSKYFTTIKQ